MQKYRAQGEGEREDKRETDLYRKVKGETQNYKKRKDTTFHAQTSISSFIVNFQRHEALGIKQINNYLSYRRFFFFNEKIVFLKSSIVFSFINIIMPRIATNAINSLHIIWRARVVSTMQIF